MKFMTEKQFEQLKADLKTEVTAELKHELRTELLKELNSKAGYITRQLPNTTNLYCVVRTDEHGNEIQTFAGGYGSEWYLDGAKEIAEQLRAGTKDGVLSPVSLHTNHYKGYVEPEVKTPYNPYIQ